MTSSDKRQREHPRPPDGGKVFWRVRIEAPGVEERSGEIWELGICGVQVHTPDELICTIEGTAATCEEFRCSCKALGLTVSPADRVVPEGWVQRDPSIWARQEVGEISIVPAPDARTARHAHEGAPAPNRTVVLIPGEGFGTGHHESTQLALLFMQDTRVRDLAPLRILDLGTGSGILAIAAAKLFPHATITATDIEEAALANAMENAELNHVASRISFHLGSLPVEGEVPAQLLCANLYAEVLVGLAPALNKGVAPGGMLILSGITSNRAQLIRAAFDQEAWEELGAEERSRADDTSETGSWTAFLFKRRV